MGQVTRGLNFAGDLDPRIFLKDVFYQCNIEGVGGGLQSLSAHAVIALGLHAGRVHITFLKNRGYINLCLHSFVYIFTETSKI